MLISKSPHERREFDRRSAAVAAIVRMPDQSELDCKVLNISEGGALLEIDAAAAVPLQFTLCTDDGVLLACEVRHRSGSHVGVEFIVSRIVNPAEPATVTNLRAFARGSR